MYRELLETLAKRDDNQCRPQPPCPESEIDRAERVVGHPFPRELRRLLLEVNGDRWLLLSAEEIVRNVELNRECYLPFFLEDFSREDCMDKVDSFVFFATNGCGDCYGYRVREDGSTDEDVIYIWEHEDLGGQNWRPVAKDMADVISRYYNNEI